MQESEVRTKLRGWILKHAKTPPRAEFTDATPILADGILSSLDIVEFVLYIESLLGEDIDVDSIEQEAFTSVNALYTAFFVKA